MSPFPIILDIDVNPSVRIFYTTNVARTAGTPNVVILLTKSTNELTNITTSASTGAGGNLVGCGFTNLVTSAVGVPVVIDIEYRPTTLGYIPIMCAGFTSTGASANYMAPATAPQSSISKSHIFKPIVYYFA
jgi:hypothetical protein